MSVLSAKTETRALRIIRRALKTLKAMPADVQMTRDDDFELSLAMNMLRSIIGHNETIIDISEPSKE